MSSTKPVRFLQREKPNSDFCCVPQCAMSGRFNSAVSFHHFPSDETLRTTWLCNIRRANFSIKKHSTVCSRHFLRADVIHRLRRRVLKEGAVPVLFPWNNYVQPSPRLSLWERTPRPELDQPTEMEASLVMKNHDYASRPDPAALDLASDVIKDQQQVMEELRRQSEDVTLGQTFGLQRFSGSDDDIRFYSGFTSYRHLLAFWRMIESAAERIIRVGSHSTCVTAPEHSRQSRHLPLIDEFFLFLVYLSLGLKERDLGERFDVHQSTVSRIVNTWIHFLYTLLGAVGIWMCPETIKKTMPKMFGPYSDTQVIVDCTELRCQVPSSLLQSEMFSTHKSHTTLKAMIGVSPHGAVTFVSSLYSGSVSDTELFKVSGIIPLLDDNMAVMVDKGFRIDESVSCKIYRPPFHEIARLRTHVERVIRRIKEKKLFETIIPLTIASSINQLFTVACLLSNYQNKPLIKD